MPATGATAALKTSFAAREDGALARLEPTEGTTEDTAEDATEGADARDAAPEPRAAGACGSAGMDEGAANEEAPAVLPPPRAPLTPLNTAPPPGACASASATAAKRLGLPRPMIPETVCSCRCRQASRQHHARGWGYCLEDGVVWDTVSVASR